uniref:MSP domain-containing protein n=1 Tax=Parastrongyloides trichosuri TaxID=131310 RepID=A0A0N5A2S8_PARTI
MFLFRKRKKQKKRRKDEECRGNENIEIVKETSNKLSITDHKRKNSDKKVKENVIEKSVHFISRDDSTSQVNEEEKSLDIEDYLNVIPQPIIIDENNTSEALITNLDKKLWICYRIVASYPINYVITNFMGFLRPEESVKIFIKFISDPQTDQPIKIFNKEHAIMVQWFFLSKPEVNHAPRYFFMKQYQKSTWKSKVVRCFFEPKRQSQEISAKEVIA